MKVQFLKDCPWSFSLTMGQRGRVTKFKIGDTAKVDDLEGQAMVNAGYAERVKPGRKPTVKPEETKIVKPKAKKAKKKKEVK